MGGIGSGKRSWKRPLTSGAVRLDIRQEPFRSLLTAPALQMATWHANGRPIGGAVMRSEADDSAPDGRPGCLVLPSELSTPPALTIGQGLCRVQLRWLPCPLGGHRAVMCCPRCPRRALVLYLFRGAWQCRTCARLVHPSTRADDHDAALLRLARIRRRMGYAVWTGKAWELPTSPGRPMRAATWARLVADGGAAARALHEAFMRQRLRYAKTLSRLLGLGPGFGEP